MRKVIGIGETVLDIIFKGGKPTTSSTRIIRTTNWSLPLPTSNRTTSCSSAPSSPSTQWFVHRWQAFWSMPRSMEPSSIMTSTSVLLIRTTS